MSTRVVRPVDDDRRWFVEPGPFPHLARLVDLPPLTAQAAFDAVRGAHSRAPQSRRWTLPAGDGRVELSGPGYVPSPPRPCYWSFREVNGKIRSQRWHLAIPVRLLLLPWSATRSAVAIELRRHPWVYTAEHFYLEAGHVALRLLAGELEDWALSEARRFYDELPWPGRV
ncbi:MAG: hypothetical protein AB1679_07560 [Actinomycetota bacterium]|jgi:hypothetical protein